MAGFVECGMPLWMPTTGRYTVRRSPLAGVRCCVCGWGDGGFWHSARRDSTRMGGWKNMGNVCSVPGFPPLIVIPI